MFVTSEYAAMSCYLESRRYSDLAFLLGLGTRSTTRRGGAGAGAAAAWQQLLGLWHWRFRRFGVGATSSSRFLLLFLPHANNISLFSIIRQNPGRPHHIGNLYRLINPKSNILEALEKNDSPQSLLPPDPLGHHLRNLKTLCSRTYRRYRR